MRNYKAAIRVLAQHALEGATTEKQLIIYEAMSLVMPTTSEREQALEIAESIRLSENLKAEFQRSQLELFSLEGSAA